MVGCTKERGGREGGGWIPQLKQKYSFTSHKMRECAMSAAPLGGGQGGQNCSSLKVPISMGWEMHSGLRVGPWIRRRPPCCPSKPAVQKLSCLLCPRSSAGSKAFSKQYPELKFMQRWQAGREGFHFLHCTYEDFKGFWLRLIKSHFHHNTQSLCVKSREFLFQIFSG